MVSNLVSSIHSATSVIVSWNEPIVQRGIITKYDIRYSNITESNSVENEFEVYERHYRITGLQPDMKYVIGVRAYTAIGPGEWNEITIILLPG